MFFVPSLRRLFRAQLHRRRPLQPRFVEILEERVLLTNDPQFDVAYFDVLKGQNFVQTSVANPVPQAGSPFHLHSSVHSPTGFTSLATLQPPVGSIKTLTQNGPAGHLSLEQSFTTKSALDTAYGSGNYTMTVMHPLSVLFSPELDVSAALGDSAGTDIFASQSAAPDSSGVFHMVWSPSTPAVDVDGQVTASHFSATLKGHKNASLTGSISADWNVNVSAYVGTYSFNGQTGSVTIPEAIAATENLPSDAYPNAPHINDFTAAQLLNPAADFTLTWDAFAGGNSTDLITLFVFDGNNQVFNTNPIPLPSNSSALDGTATSFVLPKNTLQANKTYNAQLWFTNYTTIDTSNFPGAKGATGYYIATNFTIKTGTAVDNRPADVAAYYVAKVQDFVQTSAGTPTLDANTPFAFGAFVEERDTIGATVNSSTVTLPTNPVLSGSQALQSDGGNEWDFLREFNTKTDLDAAFKAGKYTFSINTTNQGLKSPAVTLPADSYPVTPHISNWTDAQLIDASSAFTLNWEAFTSGTSDDFIQLSFVNQSGATVFKTPNFWEANPLTGTARSVVIPAGTLIAGETYNAQLLFANASTLDRTTYKNSIGTTEYSKRTAFSVQTIPPGGILQFQATGFAVAENANPDTATITVTRTGGSTGEVKIDYATSNGTATDGLDYTGVTGTLTFADGVTSQAFVVPILDDTISEGNETVALQLKNPTNGALLGVRATSTLTIVDNELTYGPGNFIDSDGDKYTVSLTGPGQARISLDDPDGDGKGPIAAIMLSNTTSTSSLSITVTKAATGDGKVPLGRVTGAGSLNSLSAASSPLIGSGLNLSGAVNSITLGDLLNGADLLIGGDAKTLTSITLGNVAANSAIQSGTTLGSLTAQSFLGNVIQARAITTLTINAGPLTADLNVTNAIKTLTVKSGLASGHWTAASFGTVAISGGGFNGTILPTANATQLGTTAAVSSLSITGGDFTGKLLADGLVGTFQTAKSNTGAGGSVHDATLTASGFTSLKIGRDLLSAMILAGTKLGADGAVGGFDANTDTFGGGTIGSFSVGGLVQSSVVGAGLDPMGEIFKNGNDQIVGGTNSAIKSLTVSGTASSDSYFRAGSLPTSVFINGVKVDHKTDVRFNDFTDYASVAQTNDDGVATLNIAGQATSFRFVNEASNQGISGLDVAVSTNTGTVGVALLMAIDPTGEYPPQMMILHGQLDTTSSALLRAADQPQDDFSSPADVVIRMFQELPGVIRSLELADKLPKVPKIGVKGVGLLETAGTIVKIIDQYAGGRLSQYATSHNIPLFKRPEALTADEAKAKVQEKLNEDLNKDVLFLTIGVGLENPIIIGAARAGIIIDSGLALRDNFFIDSNRNQPILETEFLGVPLFFTDPDPVVAPLDMTPTIPSDKNRPDRILLIRDNAPNDGFEYEIGDGSLPIPVPAGDYEMIQRRPGEPPVSSHVTIPPGGGELLLGMPKPVIASLELQATPRPTGLLDPGSQIRFTVVAKDSNGNVIPNNQIDLTCLKPQVFNPVGLPGSTVGTLGATQFAIDSNTGQLTATLTIGQANGAARVSARTCDGATSNAILISGLGIDRFNLPIISFDSTDLSIVEGTGVGTHDLIIPLSLNKLGTGPISVGYNTQDRGAAGVPASATSGKDYVSSIGTVKFTSLHATIRVPIVQDSITELSEQFVVGLLNPVNARLNITNTAVCTIVDDDQPAVIVTPTSGLVTTESGGTATFTMKLATQPTANVTVNLSSDDTTEGTVSPMSVTFTPTNWNTPQTITVKGVNDTLIDGDIVYRIITSPAVSDDPNYAGINPSDVTVTNRDNDQPTSLTGTFRGTWRRPVFGFGDEVSTLTWVLTQTGSLVTGTFTKVIVDSPISSDIGQTVTSRLVNGVISGNTLTIQTDGGTPFSGTFTLLHIEGSGGSNNKRGPFVLDRVIT